MRKNNGSTQHKLQHFCTMKNGIKIITFYNNLLTSELKSFSQKN